MTLTIEGVGKRYRGDVWGLRGFTLELGPGVLGLRRRPGWSSRG